MALSEALYMQMVDVDCAQCHVTFAIMQKHEDRLRKSQETFYCPAGHSLVFNRSKKEKDFEATKKKLEATENQLMWAEQREKRLKEELTKDKCPHCKGRFKQLKSHIKRMHPDESHSVGK